VVALALFENLARVDVNPMEEAEALAQLHALDGTRWSVKEIARRLGRTERFVQQRLALTAKLDDTGKTALRAGQITFSQARALETAARTAGKDDRQIDIEDAIYGRSSSPYAADRTGTAAS